MRINGLYINDKVQHVLVFSVISMVLARLLGPLWGIIVYFGFSISKGLHDWKGDVAHSTRFFRIGTLDVPSEFLLDQGSDIIGIVIGILLWIGIFHRSLFS